MNKKLQIHANIDLLEPEARRQFDDCCSHDFVLEAALMPDAHTGYVAPIGSVIKTKGAIVPAWVGYDIGCGMIAVLISSNKLVQDKIKEKSQEIFNSVNKIIPMGAGRHNIGQLDKRVLDSIENVKFSNSEINSELFKKIEDLSPKNMGTLGSGNHFIEILEYENETWLVIHSGSRGVGHFVGTYFMKAVSGKDKEFEKTYAILDEKMKKEYMTYQEYCLIFALENRLCMAEKVTDIIYSLSIETYKINSGLWVNKNHNHCIEIDPDIYLHRKGATSSEIDERGVIPANMKDGCFLVRGLGNVDFLNSSSHGAGRALSRGEAKRKITLEEFEEAMNGIVAPVNKNTLDESPMAYKNIFEVMELQKGSVEVVKHLKPIINWKGY